MFEWMLIAVLSAAPICNIDDPVLPENDYPMVVIETTIGSFKAELDRRRAPITVNNFLSYALNGHYDGTIFHRVIPQFVAQAGGYDEDFTERSEAAPIYNESGNGLRNRQYSLAMARHDDPHTAQAQFFINLADNDSLDPNPRRWGYAVFGQVIDGWEVVDQFNDVATGYAGDLDSEDVPIEPIKILSVKVE